MANDRERHQNEEAITGTGDEEIVGREREESYDDFEDVEEVDAGEDDVDEE
jgi:hypothetical protein